MSATADSRFLQYMFRIVDNLHEQNVLLKRNAEATERIARALEQWVAVAAPSPLLLTNDLKEKDT